MPPSPVMSDGFYHSIINPMRDMMTEIMKEDERERARPTIDLNSLEGINLKVGNETIFISKEELLEVLFKLFPNLVEKYTTAVFSEEE